MPRLLSLEMQGFKSFANRTRISFPEGLLVIIGPNGSGKSNISDAICFVLGKRSKKDMRTERLAHLIFNGGKSGKPAEFARVKLDMDNSKNEFPYKGDIFSVSRTVDSDGTSTYRINGKRCTLSEVENALKGANIDPDGMNIIMQGEIAKFVDMSTSEKREIIEDVAGISVYEDKKNKALNEMETVKSKTKEARIVLAEKKKYLDELRVEKDQAERYVEKKERLENLKAQLLLKRKQDAEEKIERIEKRVGSRQSEVENLKAEVERRESRIDELEEEVDALTKEIEEGGEEEQVRLGKEVQKLRDRVSELRTTIQNHGEEIEKIKDRKEQIDKDIEDNKASIRKLRSEKRRVESELEGLRKELDAKKRLLREKGRSEYFVLKEELMAVEKELFVKEKELEKYDEVKGAEVEVAKLGEDLKEKERSISKLDDALDGLEAQKQRRVEKLEEVDEYLAELNRKEARLSERSRSALLKNAKEVCGAGIKGVHGVLSELFEAEEHEKAVTSFAGPLVHSVVVDDLEAAGRVAEFTREHGLGEVLVIPISEMVKGKSTGEEGGVRLVDCISFDSKYEPVMRSVFSGTVTQSLQEGKECVTVEGDVLRNGVVRCGGRYEDVERAAARLEQDRKKYDRYRQDLVADIDEIRSSIEDTKIDLMRARHEADRIREDIDDLKDEMKRFSRQDREKLKNKVNELRKGKRKITKEMEGCEVVSEDLLDELRDEIDDVESEERRLEREIISIESEIKNVLERDLEKFKEIKRSLDSDLKKFRQGIKEAKEEKESQEGLLKEKEAEFQSLYSKLRDRFNKRDELKDEVKDLEKANAVDEQKIESKTASVQDMKLERAELVGKVEGLKEELKDYGDVEEPEKGVRELENEAHSLERTIDGFGPVNMKALQTYKEIESEYKKLEKKVGELESEMEEIHRMIEEIESKKNHAFMECFKRVNNNFREIFESLSPGGKGKLVIENEEEPLEGGIDFVVKPIGKKLSSLKQLSGGEKTLVTLAFIFAIQEYEAAPFYVFDEIDAALDKTNSERLAELINEYSGGAQFVIISHNDELVATADYLYGVSMKPSGVSQIVSIRLGEDEKK